MKYWTQARIDLTLITANCCEVIMDNEILDSNILSDPPGVESLSGRGTHNLARKPVKRVAEVESLLTAEDVPKRLNVSTDWVWDHSSRKKPLLPVIRMGDGALRYRAGGIEAFIDERERLSALRRRAANPVGISGAIA
jgi:hypothetical protein